MPDADAAFVTDCRAEGLRLSSKPFDDPLRGGLVGHSRCAALRPRRRPIEIDRVKLQIRHLRATERRDGTLVTGPAPAYIARRADRWRFNVVLRGRDPGALLDEGPPAPWSVDVDPESLL